jgi:phospholipid transport system substrate-binding protein
MNRMRNFVGFILIFMSVSAFATPSPTDALQQTLNKFITTLNSNHEAIKRNPPLARQLVRQIVLPLIDVNAMARSVLGRTVWESASPSEKERFKTAFVNLVLRTYQKAFTDYTYEKAKVFAPRGGYEGKQRIQVSSTVIRNGAPPVDLTYRMVLQNDGWKVYDVSVEGISLVQSYRSQFSSPLASGGLNKLINLINQRVS